MQQKKEAKSKNPHSSHQKITKQSPKPPLDKSCLVLRILSEINDGKQ